MNSKVIISIFDSIPLWVMITPIIICSIVLVAIAIERLFFFKSLGIDYRNILRVVKIQLRKGNLDVALTSLEGFSGPVIDMIKNVLLNWDEVDPEGSIIRDEASQTVKKIERFGGIIATIATIAPMLGLLGTVTGMMKSFSNLKAVGPQARDILSQGITEALITTALGLMVAIPAIVFYNYMVSQIDMFIKEIEFISNALLKEKNNE